MRRNALYSVLRLVPNSRSIRPMSIGSDMFQQRRLEKALRITLLAKSQYSRPQLAVRLLLKNSVSAQKCIMLERALH